MSKATLSAFVSAMAYAAARADEVAIAKIQRVAAQYERGILIDSEAMCQLTAIRDDSVKSWDEVPSVFPVYFEVNGSNYYTYVPAYTNGGAENKIMDALGGKCRRALAGARDGSDWETMLELYPDCQKIEVTMLAKFI